jgi:hypothetical protein
MKASSPPTRPHNTLPNSGARTTHAMLANLRPCRPLDTADGQCIVGTVHTLAVYGDAYTALPVSRLRANSIENLSVQDMLLSLRARPPVPASNAPATRLRALLPGISYHAASYGTFGLGMYAALSHRVDLFPSDAVDVRLAPAFRDGVGNCPRL